jgi:hypothetical protein
LRDVSLVAALIFSCHCPVPACKLWTTAIAKPSLNTGNKAFPLVSKEEFRIHKYPLRYWRTTISTLISANIFKITAARILVGGPSGECAITGKTE